MTDFNDSLDDLIGARSDVERAAPSRPVPASFVPDRTFTEGCTKCRGTGRFISYSGRQLGECFACKGKGKFQFKTSPEARAKATQQRSDRKASAVTEALTDFEAANPVIWAWIKANAQKFDFATKMVEAIAKFGSLTPGQLAACQRCVDREAQKAAERTERAQQAPQVASEGIDRLKAAFDTAAAYIAEKGLVRKTPKITIGGITISPAKATSANPGALYVKNGQTYLGKIAEGRFFASRECTTEDQAKVQAFVTSPAEAAQVYGQDTGTCCICNATLRSEWRKRGIGPICAEKFGWA